MTDPVAALLGFNDVEASIRRTARIAKGSIIHADEAGSWDDLHKNFEMRRINHEEAYSDDGACTNDAEPRINSTSPTW